jgi:hypothetical protein
MTLAAIFSGQLSHPYKDMRGVGQLVLQFTMLLLFKPAECAAIFCCRLVSCFTRNLEKEVLRFMAEDPYWHSPRTVSAELNRKTVASFCATFSPADFRDWARIKSHAVLIWKELRSLWRTWRIEEAMRDLCRRGLLQKVSSKPPYYRIRFT